MPAEPVSSSKAFISTTSRRFADPWPLPGSPEHLASTTTPSDIPRMMPLERRNESVDTLRARLVYQSRKPTFARDNLKIMSEEELKEYDKLLDEPDWDIYYWATGKRTPPERWASNALLEKLRVHAKNEGKVVRRMPSL
ncbi:DUF339-domain-containing protein [Gymnopus androsaceus JB14]|uniref:Succinate dehydrogenase assembly factor 2, mitochondrial n=1 Tax=Gymnopus androsaceus JB14 TaxID=1447944 RepID=A0A6A4IF56_9AGAR|nr:DUF339-domain-containing protein [Gymnopus androsaceus JB14]